MQVAEQSAIDALYERAHDLRLRGELAPALELFSELIGKIEKPDGRQQAVFTEAMNVASRIKRWHEMDVFATKAVKFFPALADAHRFLGEAQLRLGRKAEAQDSLQRAIALDDEQVDARVLLEMVRRDANFGAPAQRVRPWPTRQSAFNDPAELIQRYLLKGHPAPAFIARDTTFLTLGSCFAENLARRLGDAGYTVITERIGEQVNSTYANRYLLEWLEHGPSPGPTAAMDVMFGEPTRQRLRKGLEACDVIVMTLGVAPSFFEIESGEFVFMSNKSQTARTFLNNACAMRTTTVTENVRNIELILESIGRLSKRSPKVVLTVSPVPLGGTTEFESAVMADCVSKSTLRVACHEIVGAKGQSGVIYWPSFEIVRWLGTHFGKELPPVFGGDDDNTRHVSGWLVDVIVDRFLDHYGARQKAPATADND